MRTLILAATLLAACAHQAKPEAAAEGHPLDTMPEVGEAPDYVPPTPATFKLANGAHVWLVEDDALPLVSVRLLLPGGSAADPADRHGLTSFADAMVTRGAGDLDEKAFAEATEELAIDLSASTGDTNTWVSVDTHADRLDDALSLLKQVVMMPRFDADAIERARSQRTARLAEAYDSPSSVASMTADRLFWGPSHPLAHPSLGDEDALAAITKDELSASWMRRAVPNRATFVVSGDVDADTLAAKLGEAFADWAPGTSAPAPALAAPNSAGGHFVVDQPGSSQSILMVLVPGPAPGSDAFAPGELGGVVLGGTFTSRLNRLLREEKGYTYGARARLGEQAGFGTWVISTAVRGDATGPALADLWGELESIREGIDSKELRKAKASAVTRLVGSMGSRSSVASVFASEAAAGRGPSALADALAARQSANLDDVGSSLEGIDLSRAVVVVVGDADAIQPQLEAAGLGTWQPLAKRP